MATTAPGAGDQETARTRLPPRGFPTVPIERTIAIPMGIKEKNAGNAWEPKFVAKHVGIKHKSTRFRDLVNSARDYGLVKGTYQGNEIMLEPLGRQCVYAESSGDEAAAKKAAFLNVQLFADVLEYYKGANLPEMTYLANVLETRFDIHPEYHEEFVKLFKENCRYVGIGNQFNTNGAQGTEPNKEAVVQVSTKKSAAANGTTSGAVDCFLIMPFVERDDSHQTGFFKEVLESLIKPACESVGFAVKTASREGSDVIQSTIVNELLRADLVIADLTEHNPNVLFELGMRMAEDKPIALIRANGTGKIFDVDNMLRVFDYNPSLWKTTLAQDVPKLAKHLKAAWDNRERDTSYVKLLRQQAAPVLAPST